MSQGVVDILKVVQVEKQQGPQSVMTVAMGDGLVQTFHQQAPVREFGKVVVIGASLEELGVLAALGDVLGGQHVADHGPIATQDLADSAVDVMDFAADPLFDRETVVPFALDSVNAMHESLVRDLFPGMDP